MDEDYGAMHSARRREYGIDPFPRRFRLGTWRVTGIREPFSRLHVRQALPLVMQQSCVVQCGSKKLERAADQEQRRPDEDCAADPSLLPPPQRLRVVELGANISHP